MSIKADSWEIDTSNNVGVVLSCKYELSGKRFLLGPLIIEVTILLATEDCDNMLKSVANIFKKNKIYSYVIPNDMIVVLTTTFSEKKI